MSADRRRHRIFYTKHTEYHVRGDECVGVRDRGSGLWLLDHKAIRLRALRLPAIGDAAAWIGRRIQFWSRHMDVLTSEVVAVGRPERSNVGAYVSQAAAGEIGDEPRPGLVQSVPGEA
jgi:hypothetical protein